MNNRVVVGAALCGGPGTHTGVPLPIDPWCTHTGVPLRIAAGER
jgi:hypothetical protein